MRWLLVKPYRGREHALRAAAAALWVAFVVIGASYLSMPLHRGWMGAAVLLVLAALIAVNVFVARETMQRRAGS